MSAIRSRNTKPELVVRRFLHRSGLRFRVHRRDLPGSPDIVLPKHRTIVNVHGCFWHHHPGCRFAYFPSSNTVFWARKFQENRERDKRVDRKLRALGWRVITVWECEVAKPSRLQRLLNQIQRQRR